MRQLAFILGAFAFAPILAAAQVDVTGTVFGGEEMPLELAHVHLFEMPNGIGTDPIETLEVSSDGSFSLTIDEPGYYNLAFTGVDHKSVTTPLIVTEDDEEITLKAMLAPFTYNGAPEELRIIGDWNDFDFGSATTMERNEKGAFVYTFETDQTEVHYQIIGLATGFGQTRSINQPGSERYVYDGGGDYRSIMEVEPGEVTIVVDPAMLPSYVGGGDIVMFDEMWRNQIGELQMIYDETVGAIMQGVQEAREQAEETGEEFSFDPTPFWNGVAEMASNFMMVPDHDDQVRGYAALTLAKVMTQVSDPEAVAITPERIAQIEEHLPFSSPLWIAAPMAAPRVAAHGIARDDMKGQESAVLRVYEESPVPVVKGIALMQAAMIAKYTGDRDVLKERYERLVEDYGDLGNGMIDYYIEMLDPNSAVQNGNPVPDFEVVLEDGKGTVVSNESMKGTYYLIDFWATWCGPCVAEMPELHAAYERFAGDNFEVLSLSFDSDFGKVEAFREARYAMPWLHTFVEGGFRNKLAQSFEVRGIPKPILVNPDGIIVATESELRGDRLEKTLAKFLGDEQASN